MAKASIGVIHPGEMGSFVAASVRNSGYEVLWASAGRSSATCKRAEKIKLTDAGSPSALIDGCSAIISVCPPHAAEAVAVQVINAGFSGLYLDANAISPQRIARIAEKMAAAGIAFVDGGIIGVPDWNKGKTRIYLSGARAPEAAEYFSAGPLGAMVIGSGPGKASALKMCYAAYTKGTTALQCAVSAAAESLGVREELERQWKFEGSGLAETVPQRIQGVTAKAWRYSGEMEEIAETFTAAGVPGMFHAAAAEIYSRLAAFKDAGALPPLADVLAALIKN